MNKPVPWNIRGVGFDARETARLAAKRAGVSLGEWLNEIIAARAAELGVSADDIEPDDRLEAIAARLSDGHHALVEADGPAAAMPAQAPAPRSVDAWWTAGGRPTTLPPRTQPGSDQDRRERSTAPEGSDASTMALRARPEAQFSGTVGARLASTGNLALAETPTELAVAETAVVPVGHPEPGSATDLARPPSSLNNARATALPAERVSLDERLNAVLERLNRSFEEAERFGEAAAANLGRGGDLPDETQRGVAIPAPVAGPLPKTGADTAVSAKPANPAAVDFDNLHAAFKILASKLEAQTTGSGRASEDVTGVAQNAAALVRRLEQADGHLEPATKSADGTLDTLRADVAQLSARLGDLAPEGAFAALEAAVKDLSGRIDLSRLDGVKASVLAPVERLSRDMREAIRAIDPSNLVEGLRSDMKALSHKVEDLQGGRNGAEFDTIRDELRHMRTSLDTAASRLALSGQLRDEIATLGVRVDGLAEGTTPSMSRDLGQAVGDIRELLLQFGSGGLLGSIDRRITTLASRVETLAEQRAPATIDELSREIDRAHASLAATLAQRVDPQSLVRIEEEIGTLSAKVDTMGRANHDMAALYGLVGELTNRIEQVQHPEADGQALNALQNQIGQLVERFDRSESGATTLGGLERLIGDLFLQIEQSRNVAIDAAENAARTAAQDTLRAALDNPALNGGELTVQTGLDVSHVSQELAELRRIQEASERRVNTTLTALNTTLERLVDRMIADRAAPAVQGTSEVAQSPLQNEAKQEPRPGHNRSARDAAWRDAAPAPFDPEHFLLEPGSLPMPAATDPHAGAAALKADTPVVELDRRDSENAGSVGALIAAARHAAQLAQASAAEAARSDDHGPDDPPLPSGKLRSFFARRRRPLLLSLAGLVLLLGTLQVVKMSTDHADDVDASAGKAAEPQTSAPSETASAPAPARPAEAPPAAPKPAPGDTSLLSPPADAGATASGFADGSGTKTAAAVPPPAPATPGPAGISPNLRDLASGGNANAQFEVGSRLADGRGVTRDPREAVGWFERAAQQGLAPAQYRLGSVYEKGVGRATDANLAMGWYEKAANGGNIRAMHNLAVMLAEGAGTKPDYGKAVTWFTKAASYGVRDSQFNLAVLFARGLGVPQDLGQSYAWFALAAEQGDPDAAKKRDTVGAKLDAKALAGAKTTAANFKALTPDPTANDVAPPAGGWDAAVAPPKTAARKGDTHLSSM